VKKFLNRIAKVKTTLNRIAKVKTTLNRIAEVKQAQNKANLYPNPQKIPNQSFRKANPNLRAPMKRIPKSSKKKVKN